MTDGGAASGAALLRACCWVQRRPGIPISFLIALCVLWTMMELRPHVLPARQSHDELNRLLQRFPLPVDETTGKPFAFSYGTAGFRYDASLLECIMIRVGIFAAVRASQLKQDVGIMVTASHNDESYNGVKLADPNGGMMDSDGERMATELANMANTEDVMRWIQKHDFETDSLSAVLVHVGRDTRSHSPAFSQLAMRAAQAIGAAVISHGIITTPMLHHAVRHANPHYLPLLIPPRPNVVGYFDLLAHSYYNLLLTGESASIFSAKQSLPLVVDCACGVGYDHVVRLNDLLQQLDPTICRRLVARNAPGEGPLNDHCGSEHVQKEVCPPKWYSEGLSCNSVEAASLPYACSLDGDADRIVFFSTRTNNQFSLADGDKIATLICTFLQQQMQELETCLRANGTSLQPALRLGVVQTAYANGASTAYLRKILGEDRVLIAKTGVKHVHHTAESNLDVGVYFEANGHGTVLFGEKFDQAMAHAKMIIGSDPSCVALRRLCLLPSLVNQAVGDALSDMLLVDAILKLQGWSMDDWSALYQDLPSRQCKVKVQDRSVITTNENETKCLHPAKLQNALDNAMDATRNGRCFVRPSGTENVVRVYAEALSSQEADALASKAAQLIHDFCGGTSTPPSFPSSKI